VAIEEFSERGYRGATIDAMVQRLGIAKGSMYQYFGSKKGLFLFVFHRTVEMVRAHLKEVKARTSDQDLFERIRQSLLSGVAFIQSRPRIFTLYAKLLHEESVPFREELLRTIRGHAVHYLMSLLQEAKEKGEIRKDMTLEAMAFVLDAVMDRFLQAYALPHMDGDLGLHRASPEEVARWAGEIVELVRSGMTEPPGSMKSPNDLPTPPLARTADSHVP
jgi:AcrR family transcriptional regulator